MPLVPFDTSTSPWLESGEWVRVKDATDRNYDREGEITDRTIYGGTVHFEDCDVVYRNDQLERLGQRRAVVWKTVDPIARAPSVSDGSHRVDLYRNDVKVASQITMRIAIAAIDRLIQPGDTYQEIDPTYTATLWYDNWLDWRTTGSMP